jgi:hypothetical protein
MLMSATLSPEVERLTQMVLHNPVTLNLMEASASANGAAGDLDAGSGAFGKNVCQLPSACT